MFTQQMNYRDELTEGVDKQRLSDTFLTFLPKNTSGYTYVNQLIDVQIPKSEHVINLAKAYIDVKLRIPLKLDAAFSAPGNNHRFFVGLLNSGTMFDQVQIHSNNKVILSDTFIQVNSRIWQMSKPSHYLHANGHTFINIDDISYNEGFVVQELTRAKYQASTDTDYDADKLATKWHDEVFTMKIPLPMIFNCFDNCEAFSTTMLNDNVTLTMQLSSPEKYLCLFETDADGKLIKTMSFDDNKQCIYNGTHYVEYSTNETGDDSYRIEEGFKIIVPGHYPSEEEKIDISNAIGNGMWFREFTTTWIQAQDASFGPNSKGSQSTQTSLNYNTSVSNLYGIIMLAAHNKTYCVYDKPCISDIEMNASEIWKLANGHTHTDSTYTGDNDMYLDLLNVFGQQTFKNLSRFDKAVTHDFRSKEYDYPLGVNTFKAQSSEMLGSYMQYYRFAPSNQMGYSGDYFANQINYKFKSGYREVEYGGNTYVMTPNNYDNSTMFCCCQTLSLLVFKEGGLDVIDPFSEEIDVRTRFDGRFNSYAGNGHGLSTLIPGLISPVTNLIGKGISGLRGLVKENRNHANLTYAYSQLGPDEYEKRKEFLEARATMPKRKYKKFINGLKQMDNAESHGLTVKVGAHGIASEPEEIAEPATFDELNLQPFVQSYSADLADCSYRNQLILDYKFRFNVEKLRLSSFGSEAALQANNYHGRVGDWFRRVGRKIKGWFKSEGKGILKGVGKDLLGVAKEYAAKIATGEMDIKDISSLKPELKQQIMSIVKNNTQNTKLEGITGDAMNWYRKYKSGELKWNEIPKDMIARIKEIDLKSKSGQEHGIIIRHGFVAGAHIHPSVTYAMQKQRMKKLMGMNPMEMRRKDLRRRFLYQQLKENPPVDMTHGRLSEFLKRRYHMLDARLPAIAEKKLITKASESPYKAKWKADKAQLIQNEHGVSFLQKLNEKSQRFGGMSPDARYHWMHKKAKKFLSKWQDRIRAQQAAAQENTDSSDAHGLDYAKMKAIWKKYKSQYRPK